VCVCFSGTVKFLEVIKPFCAVLPEIQKPERKVSATLCSYFYWFTDKRILWYSSPCSNVNTDSGP